MRGRKGSGKTIEHTVTYNRYSAAAFTNLIMVCFASALFLKSSDGRKFLGYAMQLSAELVDGIHDIIKSEVGLKECKVAFRGLTRLDKYPASVRFEDGVGRLRRGVLSCVEAVGGARALQNWYAL